MVWTIQYFSVFRFVFIATAYNLLGKTPTSKVYISFKHMFLFKRLIEFQNSTILNFIGKLFKFETK